MTDAITLKADKIRGVQQIDIYDEENCENINMMKAVDFYDSLSTLRDDETIYAQFDISDAEIFGKIIKEFGIN